MLTILFTSQISTGKESYKNLEIFPQEIGSQFASKAKPRMQFVTSWKWENVTEIFGDKTFREQYP